MSIQTTCCVIGHRDLAASQIPDIRNKLRLEILLAIDDGFTHFISGFAKGTDLLFASEVTKLQDEGEEITLEAALSYRGRLRSKDATVRRLLKRCVSIGVTAEDYTPSCHIRKNQNMVQLSARVIAVYDGRERGDTAFTLRYASVMERDLRIISL